MMMGNLFRLLALFTWVSICLSSESSTPSDVTVDLNDDAAGSVGGEAASGGSGGGGLNNLAAIVKEVHELSQMERGTERYDGTRCYCRLAGLLGFVRVRLLTPSRVMRCTVHCVCCVLMHCTW